MIKTICRRVLLLLGHLKHFSPIVVLNLRGIFSNRRSIWFQNLLKRIQIVMHLPILCKGTTLTPLPGNRICRMIKNVLIQLKEGQGPTIGLISCSIHSCKVNRVIKVQQTTLEMPLPLPTTMFVVLSFQQVHLYRGGLRENS